MGELIPWIQVTISGFVYLTAGFFILLSIFKKYDFTFINIKDYLPYLAILTVFLSYAVGYAAHLAIQPVVYLIRPEFAPTGEKMMTLLSLTEKSNEVYKSINDTYSNLVMFRHLFIATILLGISLCIWLWKNNNKYYRWKFLITCFLFAVLFFIAWRMLSHSVAELKAAYL